MKLKIRVSTAMSIGVGILCILGGAGCSSSGSHALLTHDAQCLAGDARLNSRAGLTRYQTLGFTHGSAVSPLGDAPCERDLELTWELSINRRAPCVACVAELGQTGLAR